jgi:hypothetical protein
VRHGASRFRSIDRASRGAGWSGGTRWPLDTLAPRWSLPSSWALRTRGTVITGIAFQSSRALWSFGSGRTSLATLCADGGGLVIRLLGELKSLLGRLIRALAESEGLLDLLACVTGGVPDRVRGACTPDGDEECQYSDREARRWQMTFEPGPVGCANSIEPPLAGHRRSRTDYLLS